MILQVVLEKVLLSNTITKSASRYVQKEYMSFEMKSSEALDDFFAHFRVCC
jgi:hypothetical protein